MNLKPSLSILGIAFTSALFSCKEQPVGDLTKAVAQDTTYVTAPPAAQTKNYYIEEFSGVRCINCPNGAEELENLQAQYPGRLVVTSIHAGDLTAPNYNKGSIQTFKTDDGESILSVIYGGDPGKPCASFDRLPIVSGSTNNYLNRYYNQWSTMLSSVMQQYTSTPVNIDVKSTYSSSTDEYLVNVKVAYNEAMSGSQYLSVYIMENHIIDKQIDPEIDNFEFNHVFRGALTAFNGTPILDTIANKEAGRVLESNFKLKIDKTDAKQQFWKPENMKVVAFVHNATSENNKRVYQVQETKLVP